ncbi:hypothetical protein, partial [uncultured Brevundimonas sp.]|uniref:hypothetical protein n=1 Tax=uncultured Brevundimonas sp. TaxID=213418 RepID=UPI0026022872
MIQASAKLLLKPSFCRLVARAANPDELGQNHLVRWLPRVSIGADVPLSFHPAATRVLGLV